VLGRLNYSAIPVDEPLLKGQLGYQARYAQATANTARANALLNSAGWRTGSDGIRTKGGKRLAFALSVPSSADYTQAANTLSSQWRKIGVDAQVSIQAPADFQTILTQHAYDAVLYGIAIGVDPDVFVYWDSSQADVRSTNRLNFSEYASTAADVSLEAARTRLDPVLRTAKYATFLRAWQQDAPALGLYQPRFLYISHTTVYGLSAGQLNTDAGRYRNVESWMIHRDWVTR
jgi:peptide/nickel transport system substrate-binding protein